MTNEKNLNETAMEDTLASIKNMVEGTGESTQSAATSNADVDDILNLTETEMVQQTQANDELIDIKKFDESGNVEVIDEKSKLVAKAEHGDDEAINMISADLKGEPEQDSEDSAKDTSVNVDDVLASLNQTADHSTSAETTKKDSLSQKAEQLEKTIKNYSEKDFDGSQEYEGEDDVYDNVSQQDSTIEDINKKMVEELSNAKITEKVALKAIPSASGLQVGFPIEVLAEALRPMITSWVEENLPSVVEKLVKEELSKLADKS